MHTIRKRFRRVVDWCHVYQFLKVPEFNETNNMRRNNLHRKVSLYLHSLPSIEDADFTNLITGNDQTDIVLRLDPNQTIEDRFLGATLYWFNQKTEPNRISTFVLQIRKTDKRRILRQYLRHINTVADEMENQSKRNLRLFMNASAVEDGGTRWRSVPFTHPAMFETMAMEKDLKNKIKSDLESFLKAKQYYRKIGRAWKRSYLLYGAGGTGKSSFVAAMANFLRYDVYDVDLSKIRGDSDLMFLLTETTAKSVIVVEDLDRFLEPEPETATAVTASGIQSFMDGIVSACCGEERVMVFTMNSKECVDPDLLRPGRVDVHIHFPVCDFSAFKTLASSYLGVRKHKLFAQVEEIFRHGATLSPAEISELMIANRTSPSRAIKSVIGALQSDGDGRRSYADSIRRRIEGDDVDKAPCGGDGFSTVKDIRKLYGFFKLRNGRRTSQQQSNSSPHDT
ncbi:hypothetical protein JHK87_043992 [Glycine soja]|nr:hypothetical protein JHK87_043992 [Glycine soja]